MRIIGYMDVFGYVFCLNHDVEEHIHDWGLVPIREDVQLSTDLVCDKCQQVIKQATYRDDQ